MASYLAIIEEERKCEGCQQQVGPGLAGFTDEIGPGKIVPICGACFHSRDPRLYVVWRLSKGLTRPLKHVLEGASIVDTLESMPPE